MATKIQSYHYWKWTKDKSGRIEKSNRGGRPKENTVSLVRHDKKKCMIEEDPYIISIGEQQRAEERHIVSMKTIHEESSNKRQVCNERISSRYMIIQTNINPYLHNNNYLKDLSVQDAFLRPKDSNIKESE